MSWVKAYLLNESYDDVPLDPETIDALEKIQQRDQMWKDRGYNPNASNTEKDHINRGSIDRLSDTLDAVAKDKGFDDHDDRRRTIDNARSGSSDMRARILRSLDKNYHGDQALHSKSGKPPNFKLPSIPTSNLQELGKERLDLGSYDGVSFLDDLRKYLNIHDDFTGSKLYKAIKDNPELQGEMDRKYGKGFSDYATHHIVDDRIAGMTRFDQDEEDKAYTNRNILRDFGISVDDFKKLPTPEYDAKDVDIVPRESLKPGQEDRMWKEHEARKAKEKDEPMEHPAGKEPRGSLKQFLHVDPKTNGDIGVPRGDPASALGILDVNPDSRFHVDWNGYKWQRKFKPLPGPNDPKARYRKDLEQASYETPNDPQKAKDFLDRLSKLRKDHEAKIKLHHSQLQGNEPPGSDIEPMIAAMRRGQSYNTTATGPKASSVHLDNPKRKEQERKARDSIISAEQGAEMIGAPNPVKQKSYSLQKPEKPYHRPIDLDGPSADHYKDRKLGKEREDSIDKRFANIELEHKIYRYIRKPLGS
jgi:hypothetical protein